MELLYRQGCFGVTFFIATISAQVAALANPIYVCPTASTGLQDMKVYAHKSGSTMPVTSSEELEVAQKASAQLYFVVRPAFGDRKGAIVVKTARFGLPRKDDRTASDRVRLRREVTSTVCNTAEGYRGTISTKAYQEYHDRGVDQGRYLDAADREDAGGGDATAFQKLKRFHTTYEATSYSSTRERCRATDEMIGENGAYESRNNRSQFSFVVDVVDHGMSTLVYTRVSDAAGWIGSILSTTAQADGNKLRERRVEIRPYQTYGGIACIPIKLKYRDDRQILRINDLDRRTSWGPDWVRASEFRLGPTDGGGP